MLFAAIISSIHSTCRSGFTLRSRRVTSTENWRSANNGTASGQMPSSKVARR